MDQLLIVDWSGKIWRGTSTSPTAVTLTGLRAGGETTSLPLPASAGAPLIALSTITALALAAVYVRNHNR